MSYLFNNLAIISYVKGEKWEHKQLNNKTKWMESCVYCITCHLTRAAFSTTGVFLMHIKTNTLY